MILYISTSIGEAQSYASQLQTLIEQVLEVDSEISRRLTNLETQVIGYSHNSISNLGASNINSVAAEAGERKVENKSGNSGTTAQDLQNFSFNFTFDQDLKNSRPYARAGNRNSSWSTNSSLVHTMSWSCLSGLSLAEIFKVSVIRLPITAQELWNGDNYTIIELNRLRLFREWEHRFRMTVEERLAYLEKKNYHERLVKGRFCTREYILLLAARLSVWIKLLAKYYFGRWGTTGK